MHFPLTTRQRAALRSQGQKLADDCHLGKAGLSESFLMHLDDLFSRKELVKLRFDDIQGAMRKEMADELADIASAHLVGVTGRTMLLYRPNPTLPPEKRVKLGM